MNQQTPSSRPGVSKLSIVAQVADMIREDVFNLPDGALLGSEEELIARYGVSRPTLREAAALVIQEQMLTARRGIGGGFFVRRPDADVVKHIVALYLRAHKVDLLAITSSAPPIRSELARLAVASQDAELRQALANFLDEDKKHEPAGFAEHLQAERTFNHLLGELSGNRILSLFFDIILDLSKLVHWRDDIFKGHPERFEALRRSRRLLGQAILDRDEDLAMYAVRQPDFRSWLLEVMQMERGGKADATSDKA